MTFFRTSLKGRVPTVSALLVACAATVGYVGAAHAAEPVLLQGPQASISTQDILADAERIPEEMRGTVLGRAQTVLQIATNLYIRRAMAQEATKLGFANDAAVKAALQVAQDKALSDAYLAHLDKQNIPTPAVAESLARNLYKAKPESFKLAEQVQIRHILIDTKGDEGRAIAEKLLQEIKSGANFAELAKTRSADKGSAARGGDLGFFEHGKMVPDFDKAAFALKAPGDLSDVVPTQFGFHILQLEARKPAGQQTFEEVREALIKQVSSEAAQSARVAAADKFRAQAQPEMAAIDAFAASMKATAKP